ncbi:MAG: tetratricopeptide repeat protein [Chitinophagaceae bacterium]
MKAVLVIFLLAMFHCLHAQTTDVKSLQETARTFSKQGDYANAAIVLSRALQQDQGNLQIIKDLAFAQYMQKDLNNAFQTVKSIIDRKDADVEVYQIAGMIYKEKGDFSETEKLYKKGLRKFPASGVLYNEYGELLWYRQDYNAIRQWEKGIEVDPNFSSNYYNAAKYYYFTVDKTWSLIYGEIFVNLESLSRRTIEIKSLLINSYKKIFSDGEIMKNQNAKNEFSTAFLNTINKQTSILSLGITPESLTMIRTRFLLDWDDRYAQQFPFRLFEYHRQLLREGLFDAYNQWLFGPVQNLTSFQNWTNTHAEIYKEFTNFQRGRVFKLPTGQNYQSKNL